MADNILINIDDSTPVLQISISEKGIKGNDGNAAQSASLDAIQAEVDNLSIHSASINIFTGSIQAEVTNLTSATGSYLLNTTDTFNGNLLINGTLEINNSTIMSGSVDITDGISSIDYITFNTTPENTPTVQGTLQWNPEELTLDLIQNGTTLQVGQEQQYQVVNDSGVNIGDGMAVMAVGTNGASGNIRVALMDGSDTVNTKRFLGVSTEAIDSGDVGKVTTFGKVRGVKTDYSGSGDWGGLWEEGDILYISSTIPGVITNIEPVFPGMAMPVAFVLNTKSNGTIHVRVNNLNKHEFIQVDEDRAITADLTISGSLKVFEASGSFSGSFRGDGSGLTGLEYRLEEDLTVSGSKNIDWDSYETFYYELTGDCTFTDTNLPLVGSKLITIYMTGSFTPTWPVGWVDYINGGYTPGPINTVVAEYVKISTTPFFKVLISQPD